MAVSKHVVGALLEDLTNRQVINKNIVVNIESALESNLITSQIPLTKFTDSETKVNFEDAKTILDLTVPQHLGLDKELLLKTARKLKEGHYGYISLYNLLQYNNISSNYFLRFLIEPNYEKIYDDKNNLVKVKDLTISEYFLHSTFISSFLNNFIEYLITTTKDDKVAESNARVIDELKNTRFENETYNLGYIHFLHKEFSNEFSNNNITMNDLIMRFSSANIEETRRNFKSYIQILDKIINDLEYAIDSKKKLSWIELAIISERLETFSGYENSVICKRLEYMLQLGRCR